MPQTNTPMTLFTKIVFWFVAINALAGAGSLILLPGYTDTLFFWTIAPPLNAALFGALYLGGAVAVGWLAYGGEWEPARFLIPVLVSAGIFITVTTWLHLDKFAPGFKLFYWLVVYIAAPLLALLIYYLQERGGANWAVTRPVRPVTRSLAIVVGALLIGLGIGVILWPDVVISNWPWPTSPLMVRIFAAWFSAFGVGLLWFWVERDWNRLQYVANLMIAAAALDLIFAFVHYNNLTSTGLSFWLFCFHLAAFGLLGLLLHWLQRDVL
jgi:hypothetical protein